MQLLDNPKGNYRFLTGIAPYSSGAIAMPEYEIVRAVFRRPPPYRQGFERMAQYLAEQERARQAVCGIELRSPRPFTFEGFADFNQGYLDILAAWDIPVDGHNPVARTNVAPEVGAPHEPVLYAFSYTVPSHASEPPTFVIAGAGDLAGGNLSPEAIVRGGEISAEAMRQKARHVMGIMQTRLSGLGATWSAITAVDIYTVHPLHTFLPDVILESMQQAAIQGIHWFYSRPPVVGLEFEMDMRGVNHEIRLN
jgi:hypothetical protein